MTGIPEPVPLPAKVADAHDASAERRRKQQQRLFLRNITVLIVVGVAMSWWAVEFTDVFPTIGGLLGLGGVFAWVAFLTNLITKERKEQIQADLEASVLLADNTATYALLVLLAFGLFAATQGTLVLIGAPDGPKRAVDIRDGDRLVTTIAVAANSTVKTQLFAGQARTLTVHTAGLPMRRVVLHAFDREELAVPSSFTAQPVILAHLPTSMTTSAMKARAIVSILRKGTKQWSGYGVVPHENYNGQSFWIGADADVAVPDRVRSNWIQEPREVMDRWSRPVAVNSAKPLRAGDVIRVCVLNADAADGTLASGEVTVLSPAQQQFPQLLELDLNADAPPGRCP
jgi:hypothetical protein